MIKELAKCLNKMSSIKINQDQIEEIIRFLDLTNLDDKAQWPEILKLCENANEHKVAAICILPQHIKKAKQLCETAATVINFPGGNQSIDLSLTQINTAIEDGADEIDFVWDYNRYLRGEAQSALDELSQCFQLCHDNNKLFKVILETGKLPNIDTIYKTSRDIIESGCDFLKTSTGKVEIGASLEAAFAMLMAIKDSNKAIGLKVSGGIKTAHQALQYATMTQDILGIDKLSKDKFRIGASSLIDELNASLVTNTNNNG